MTLADELEAATAGMRLDALAEAAHNAWYAEKARRLAAVGLSTWPSETGEEQLVPWADLSEPVREFDRIVVRAILSDRILAALRDADRLREALWEIVEVENAGWDGWRTVRLLKDIASAALSEPVPADSEAGR